MKFWRGRVANHELGTMSIVQSTRRGSQPLWCQLRKDRWLWEPSLPMNCLHTSRSVRILARQKPLWRVYELLYRHIPLNLCMLEKCRLIMLWLWPEFVVAHVSHNWFAWLSLNYRSSQECPVWNEKVRPRAAVLCASDLSLAVNLPVSWSDVGRWWKMASACCPSSYRSLQCSMEMYAMYGLSMHCQCSC